MNNKRTVMFVVPWGLDHPGGVSQVVNNLLKQCSRSTDYNPVLMISSWKNVFPKKDEIDGIPVIYFRIPFGRADKGLKDRMLGFLGIHFLQKVIRNYRISIVNIHYPILNSYSFLRIKQKVENLRIFMSFHGKDLDHIKQQGDLDQWGEIFAGVDCIVSCSKDLEQKVRDVVPGNSIRMCVIDNGIDPDAIDESVSIGTFPEELKGENYILNVATFEHKKGQDVLIKAFFELIKIGFAQKLVLIGRAGETLEALCGLIAEKGIEDKVVILKNLDHAKTLKIIEGAQLFVLSSREEPFGIVLLEAGYLGVPVVATSVGGVPHVVDSGACGYLVRSESVEELSRGIQSALLDKDETEKNVIAMKRRVLESFTWEKAFLSYARLFA